MQFNLDDLSPAQLDALQEVGNILAGAYLSALNEFLGMLLLISVPTLVFDMAGAILSTMTGEMEDVPKVICVETRFMDDQENLGGYFILAPDPISLRAI